MSLIGSLEDLGLGDILQIISLSRKSGVLTIRSNDGEGRIVFREGLVRGASLKGDPADLRELLVGGGFVDGDDYDAASRCALEDGVSIEEALERHARQAAERVDSLRRESVEGAVMKILAWNTGEFSFDVRSEPEDGDPPLFLVKGINAQYLAMENARIEDERGEPGELELVDEAPPPMDVTKEILPEPAEAADAADLEAEPLPEAVAVDAVAEAEPIAPAEIIDPVEIPATATAPTQETPQPRPLVVIDSDLPALEWTKGVLEDRFARTHIFQRSDLGLTRIRQYLARAEVPVVLISPDVPADTLGGIRDARDFVRRLKRQAGHMPVLWLRRSGVDPEPNGPADGVVLRPAVERIQDRAAASELEDAARTLCAELEELLSAGPAVAADRDGDSGVDPVRHLKETVASFGDASSRGEVLPLVIRFARETFSRVAMFMVRDDQLFGMAQSGLERAGGPDDAGVRALRFDRDSCAWFRQTLERSAPLRSGPSDDGDRRLAERLGDRAARHAYLAPIESAGQVAALLYADNLPSEEPIGDTSALEVVLHHAGLALERAVLERALAELEEPSAGAPAEPAS